MDISFCLFLEAGSGRGGGIANKIYQTERRMRRKGCYSEMNSTTCRIQTQTFAFKAKP